MRATVCLTVSRCSLLLCACFCLSVSAVMFMPLQARGFRISSSSFRRLCALIAARSSRSWLTSAMSQLAVCSNDSSSLDSTRSPLHALIRGRFGASCPRSLVGSDQGGLFNTSAHDRTPSRHDETQQSLQTPPQHRDLQSAKLRTGISSQADSRSIATRSFACWLSRRMDATTRRSGGLSLGRCTSSARRLVCFGLKSVVVKGVEPLHHDETKSLSLAPGAKAKRGRAHNLLRRPPAILAR